MNEPIFYFKKLNTWDRVSIILYIVLSLVILEAVINAPNNKDGEIIFAYTFFTHFFLYCFNYRSLRNLSVYIIWGGIALVHLFFYWQLKDNTALLNLRGRSDAIGLRNTIILLLLFQVLRFINAKIQNQELVCPGKGSRTDIFDERQVNFVDYILLFIYIGTTLYLIDW